MWWTARRLLLTAALLAALSVPATAAAQTDLSDVPTVSPEPPPSLSATPTPTATATPSATPTATATATPSAEPRRDEADLPNTGSDAQTIALAGLSLVLFGASLRVQLLARDGRS